MKKFILVVAAVLTQSAFAVKTADCPNSLRISYANLTTHRSLKQIFTELSTSGDIEGEEEAAVKKAFETIQETKSVERVFKLNSAESGRCIYETGKKDDREKVEFYSPGGLNKFYTQTNIGPRGILMRAYGKLENYSKTSLKASTGPVSLALAIPRYPYTDYSVGGDLIFVGKASTITLEAGR